MDPLVSVIVPAYNMAGYTERTVESLLGQSYSHLEIIVIDDGSTDPTGKILERFSDRITYVYQENGGACSARNHGYRLSRGDFIGFLDCDDIYHPEKVEVFLARFRARPSVGMIYSPEYLIDENDRIFDVNSPAKPITGKIFEPLLIDNFIGSSTPIIRREVLEKAGLWDEAIFTTADWEMWLRISRCCEIDFVEEPLSSSRQVSRYNRRNIDRTQREAYYVLEKFRKEGITETGLRKARSHIEILLHRYAFEMGDYRRSLGHLVEAIVSKPFQVRAYAHLSLAVLFRPLYRSIIQWKKRIRTVRQVGCRGGEAP